MRIFLVLALTLGCAAEWEEDPTAVTEEVVSPPDEDRDAGGPPPLDAPELAPDPEQDGEGEGRPVPDLPETDLRLPDPIEQ